MEVTFNGMVLESYPGQIYASKMEVISREDDLVSLYMDILKQIYENDEGLNGDITMIAVDLSKADSFQFVASKWRSGTGANFYMDCRAEKKEGKYTFELGDLQFPDGIRKKFPLYNFAKQA